MPNTNCLMGMQCPVCESEGAFIINVKVDMVTTDEGTEYSEGEHYWDDSSYCKCQACKYEATVKEFTIIKQKKGRVKP